MDKTRTMLVFYKNIFRVLLKSRAIIFKIKGKEGLEIQIDEDVGKLGNTVGR